LDAVKSGTNCLINLKKDDTSVDYEDKTGQTRRIHDVYFNKNTKT